MEIQQRIISFKIYNPGILLFRRSNLALSLGDKLTARIKPFHVNMKSYICIRHVHNTGMPVTFNTFAAKHLKNPIPQ